MRKIQIFILFLWANTVVFGQTAASADALFQEGNYAEAREQYGRLVKSYPNHALYLYRYARCAQELGDYTTAIKYFELSGNRYDLKHFHLAEVCMKMWYVEDAITAYQTYLTRPNIDSARATYVQQQIHYAERLQRYLRRVEKLHVIDSIDVALDRMLDAFTLSAEAGALSYDSLGQVMYTNQRGDRKLWTEMNDSTAYIVTSHRLLDQWTSADTMPEVVNQFSKQINPYILSDGVTLYYAACDTNGFGGYDLYVTRYNTSTETYTNPENLGLPYNSPANEYLLAIDEGKKIGYLATDRFSAKDSVRIYSFVPTEYKQYWREISRDSLIAYAQLKSYIQAEKDIESIPEDSMMQDEKDHKVIFFALNDSVVYTSLDDFRNPQARKLYQDWEKKRKQLQQDKEQLAELRLQYSESNVNQQKKIAPTILKLEKQQSQSTAECNQLLYSVQEAELSHKQ